MSWRDSIEEKISNIEDEGVEETVKQAEGDYRLDQRELGKILIISSTTLLIISAHAALTFKSAHNSMDKVNDDLNSLNSLVASQSFQNSLDAIESLNSRAISSQVSTALNFFESVNGSIGASNSVEKELRKSFKIYQWMALIALLGEIAGISLIYL